MSREKATAWALIGALARGSIQNYRQPYGSPILLQNAPVGFEPTSPTSS